MKNYVVLIMCTLLCSCQRNSSQTWEDVKTAKRYVQQGVNSLWGKNIPANSLAPEEAFDDFEDEYIPLDDKDLNGETILLQKKAPLQTIASATLPDKAKFLTPSTKLTNIFRTLHFEIDNHVVKEKYDLITVAKIANYMKKNTKTYLLIEGHCDQKASADYNLALGSRRANHIRVLLVKQGVDPKKVITVSYGKEKLVAVGMTPKDRALNRRAEFKIYEKQ